MEPLVLLLLLVLGVPGGRGGQMLQVAKAVGVDVPQAATGKAHVQVPRLRPRSGLVYCGLRLLMQLDGLPDGLFEPPQPAVEAVQEVHLGGEEADGDRHQEGGGGDDGDLLLVLGGNPFQEGIPSRGEDGVVHVAGGGGGGKHAAILLFLQGLEDYCYWYLM